MKGWYFTTRPDQPSGESTAWYASFWGFSADCLNGRFKTAWCLSSEQSISLHAGDWTVPKPLLVRTPKGGNKPTTLVHGTSVLDVRSELPPPGDIEQKLGLQLMKLPAALITCDPREYAARPVTARAALAMVPNASEVLRGLLAGGHSKVAGRLAGAFRNIGRTKIADDILASMRSGYLRDIDGLYVTFCLCVPTSLYGWKWTHRPFPDERYAGIGWLPLDNCAAPTTRCLYGGARIR